MNTILDLVEQRELAEIAVHIHLIEAEFKAMLNQEVTLSESYEEQTLQNILNDVERRIDAAKRGLAAANKLPPAERKEHKSRMMSHLNRSRQLLNRVIDQFYPASIDGVDNPGVGDELITPQQAAKTLGVPTWQLHSLVNDHKLKMHNDNGEWAFSGREIDKLRDELESSGKLQKMHDRNAETAKHFPHVGRGIDAANNANSGHARNSTANRSGGGMAGFLSRLGRR